MSELKKGGAGDFHETSPEMKSGPVRLVSRMRVANTFWSRLKGLLGSTLGDDEGLYITPGSSIHTIGMSYPIDVVFLDAAGKALALYHRLKPWRMTHWIRGASGVLELPEGTLEKHGLRVGQTVEISAQTESSTQTESSKRPFLNRRFLVNLILCAVWVFFAAHLVPRLLTGNAGPSAYLLFVVNSCTAFLFLTRREEKRVTKEVTDRLITVICILTGFSLRLADDASIISSGMESALSTVSLVLVFAAYLSLGRSFGLIPADRGLKLGGMYNFVRHPLYGGEMLNILVFLLANFTIRNFTFTVGVFLALHLRALAEERLLAYEPAYQAYCRQIRKRYIPFLV
ncbi:MAG: DUF192 domain-containing protein [bacterium]